MLELWSRERELRAMANAMRCSMTSDLARFLEVVSSVTGKLVQRKEEKVFGACDKLAV
jgi:hypothetical protein